MEVSRHSPLYNLYEVSCLVSLTLHEQVSFRGLTEVSLLAKSLMSQVSFQGFTLDLL